MISFGQAASATLDHFLLQLEAGDAVDQQAARAIMPIIDGDGVAGLSQSLGGGETGGAGADDAH